ncbi:MAG: hypothetical protein ACO1OO_05710 [Flavisolibacter sp.]
MSESTQALANLLPGKHSPDDYTLQEIEQLTQQYPYFAPAQFLLLEKLKQSNPEQYQKSLQKARLYYHDPLQLEWILSSEKFQLQLNDLPDELESQSAERAEIDDAPTEEESIETNEVQAIEPAEALSTEIEESATDEEELEGAEEDKSETDLPPLNISGVIEKTIVAEKEEAPEESITPEKALQQMTISAAPEGLTFEPYHTIDYFASQGIKMGAEEKSTDKFGKQVRSFTDWLKVMKKLPVSEMGRNVDAGAERKVENLAEHSVDEANVVTEAMAEVWLKQGNKQKAIETYNKLSLLNPSKKAYFAAQIEHLKQS